MKWSRLLFTPWCNRSRTRIANVCIHDRRAALGIGITISALALLSGCTTTTRLNPEPQTEGLPRVTKYRVNAGIYYSPQFINQEQSRVTGAHTFTAPIGAASVRLFDDVLPRVFEKTTPISKLSVDEIDAKQVDLVVVPSLQHFDFLLGLDSDSERFSVLYRTTLYSKQGVPVASWLVGGKEREKTSLGITGFIEDNMVDAATKFVKDFDRNAGPALAAIAKNSKGQSNPIERASVVLNAMRTEMPGLEPKIAASLRDAGVVAIRLAAQSKTDRQLVMRASDARLKLKSGLSLEPATISAVLSALDQTSHDADIAAVFFVPFAFLVNASQQASQQEAREQQSKAVGQSLFSVRTLSKGKEEAGIIPFLLPKGTAAADGVSLTAWIVDPASADGLQLELPLALR